MTRGSVLWAPQVLMAGSLGSLRGEVPGALLDVLGFWPRWLDCMSVGRHVGAGEIQVLVQCLVQLFCSAKASLKTKRNCALTLFLFEFV